MKYFRFIETTEQGRRIYECLICGDRLTDSSINKLKKWHTHFRSITSKDVINIMDNGIRFIGDGKIFISSRK